MSAQTKERFESLVNALVILATLAVAYISYTMYQNVSTATTDKNYAVLAVILINLVFSLITHFHVRAKKLAGLSSVKCFDRAVMTTLSFTWDAVALLLAVLSKTDAALYLFVAVVLVVDCVIDTIVHFKR